MSMSCLFCKIQDRADIFLMLGKFPQQILISELYLLNHPVANKDVQWISGEKRIISKYTLE